MRKGSWKEILTWSKRTLLFIGIGLCMTGPVSSKAAQQVGTVAGHPIYDNQFGGVTVEENSIALVRRGAFTSVYDPRKTGGVSKVEDQGQTNTCWAFATIAAIEGNLIKKGYENSSVDLSENHLAYFFYNRTNDPIGYTDGDKNLPVGKVWYNNGGTLQGTAVALTTWSGVVKAETSEDDSLGVYLPKILAADQCYKSDYRVANVKYINYDVNTVKQAIMDYGAVASGIYMNNDYWNFDNGAYYYPKKEGNHAVTIVGWDDNYSKENFVSGCRPSSNGAWIVKNSYGTTYKGKPLGDYGYMYVSYEDASLCELLAYDMVKASETYNNNYQYDGTANPSLYYYQASGTAYANIFTAKAAKAGYNENLRAVGVNVMTSNVQYSLQIYTGVTSSSNPTSGKAVFKTPQTGTIANAGYSQIPLNEPVTLTSGEKYALVITLKSPNAKNIKVACDCSVNAGWIQFSSAVKSGQSFVKTGGKWHDTGKESGASKVAIWGDSNTSGQPVVAGYTYSNIRMKAYTDTTNEKTTYKLSKNAGVSKGSSVNLKVAVSPSNVKRKITWSSSNKNVATVSSSGKVKGKAYGTTTIKAKFVAGSKTKTLKCKVTVGPSKVKGFKAKGGSGSISVSWKKSSDASGYVVYYSTDKNSGYKTLGTITSNSKTKFVKKKLQPGTYYVKLQPYKKQGKTKLYGSATSVKTVVVK